MSAAPAMIVETERDAAEQQIGAAWKACQAVEKHGLEFGRVCYEWQQKFVAQGSRTGGGLRPIWDKVGIPKTTGYRWIQAYKESQHIVDVKPPKPQLHPLEELQKHLLRLSPALTDRNGPDNAFVLALSDASDCEIIDERAELGEILAARLRKIAGELLGAAEKIESHLPKAKAA